MIAKSCVMQATNFYLWFVIDKFDRMQEAQVSCAGSKAECFRLLYILHFGSCENSFGISLQFDSYPIICLQEDICFVPLFLGNLDKGWKSDGIMYIYYWRMFYKVAPTHLCIHKYKRIGHRDTYALMHLCVSLRIFVNL